MSQLIYFTLSENFLMIQKPIFRIKNGIIYDRKDGCFSVETAISSIKIKINATKPSFR